MKGAHPILSCKESAALELQALGNEEIKEWGAMNKVGVLLGEALIEDFQEIKELPERPKILILAGKGNNAGDAFLAAAEILRARPLGLIKIIHVFGSHCLKGHAKQALDILVGLKPVEEVSIDIESVEDKETWVQSILGNESFDICLDGILGMSFKAPLSKALEEFLRVMNGYCAKEVLFRASVDLPSGLGDKSGNTCFIADFTYATGTAKTPLFMEEHRDAVGRIRYLDIGFFKGEYLGEHRSRGYILRKEILRPLQDLRRTSTDKRSYGHLFIVSGSRNLPGALQMSIQAALKSGIGLLTVFAPESLVRGLSSSAPEAMWVPMPETESGALSIKGYALLEEKLSQASAILIGPGLSQEQESNELVEKIVSSVAQPLLLDADALQRNVAEAVKQRPEEYGKVIMTPHEGEFKRMSPEADTENMGEAFKEWCHEHQLVGLLKGSVVKIVDKGCIYNSTLGGPVLARGGSGDILAGLAGGLLAQMPKDPLKAVSMGVVWQGLAADKWAKSMGHVATKTTDILKFLSRALRGL